MSLFQDIINSISYFCNDCLNCPFSETSLTSGESSPMSEELWGRIKQAPFETKMKRQKWGWIGHILGTPASNITWHALDWNGKWIDQGREVKVARRTWAEEDIYIYLHINHSCKFQLLLIKLLTTLSMTHPHNLQCRVVIWK